MRKSKQKQQKSEKKKQYKVRNWKEYNEALVNRGRLIFHITEEAIEQWEERERKGKRGRPKQFSDTAVETSVALGQLLGLPLRQTEGVLTELLQRIGTDLKAPDYSTISIRSRTLSISIRIRSVSDEPIHLVIDSTGVKIFGEGEWKVRMHGWCKHRRWKKLHLGVDASTGDVLMGEATGNDVTDAEATPSLLAQLPEETPIEQVSADGGYDKRTCYDAFMDRNIGKIIIPPQENAKIWRHGNWKGSPHPRDENLRRIRSVGKAKWKEETGYHRRSLAETAIFRLKTIFTDRISARTDANQCVQLLIRCKLLNRMTVLGMPESYLAA